MSLIVTGSVGIDTVETPDGQKAESVLGGSSISGAAACELESVTLLDPALGKNPRISPN